MENRRVEMMDQAMRVSAGCTDIERFHLIDDVRRACDANRTTYEFDGFFNRHNLAWIFEKARRQIVYETEKLRDGKE